MRTRRLIYGCLIAVVGGALAATLGLHGLGLFVAGAAVIVMGLAAAGIFEP